MLKRLIIVFTLILLCINNSFAKEDFNDYLKDVRFQTEKVWNPPVFYQRHTSNIYFKIHNDGTVSDIKLAKSSKVPQLDRRALAAIQNLPKFNKFPSSYPGEYIEITVGLTNYIYQDLRNPNIYQKSKKIAQNDVIPVNTKKVKILKVVYDEFFVTGDSNFQNNPKPIEFNLNIQRALKH